MEVITLAEAKEHLEDLLARAARREDGRTCDPKVGTARLLPVTKTKRAPDLMPKRLTDTMEPFVPLAKPRERGRLKGKMQIPARLMEPMSEEELRDWYGDDA